MLTPKISPPVSNQAGAMAAPQRKWTTIRAVMTRADGTVEDRGIVSFSHRNFIINAIGAPLARFNGFVRERLARRRQRRKSS